MIHYIDCGAGFINAGNHSVNSTLLPEELHPDTAGFRVLAECLKPVVDALVLGMMLSSLSVAAAHPVKRQAAQTCTMQSPQRGEAMQLTARVHSSLVYRRKQHQYQSTAMGCMLSSSLLSVWHRSSLPFATTECSAECM